MSNMSVDRYPPVLCENCGSPDVRELERNGSYIGRRCVDCGHEQDGPGL